MHAPFIPRYKAREALIDIPVGSRKEGVEE
jgi:hypothetical protein